MGGIARASRVIGGAAVMALAAALAACGGGNDGGSTAGSYGFPQVAQDDQAEITVWVDADRSGAADAFKKANPGVPIKVVTYDGSANGSNSFRTKMQLFDRAGSGWPDVVFSTQNNDAAWASQKSGGKQAFAAVLGDGLVPQATLDGFTPGSLDPCTVDGKVYCLRNDLAQVVLWYNKTLLAKFGYAPPATWEEYQALGEQVAREHPGYIVGTVGDAWTPEVFFWGSKCQANGITGPTTVTVDTGTAECKRAAAMLDTLIKNGTTP
ncbi:MAG TPA: ABC transporter substrate-binding protein, partial [Actinoplanes sp.]|nr:ABC transporter substrate-binding protein [Actinoplanes sp.]